MIDTLFLATEKTIEAMKPYGLIEGKYYYWNQSITVLYGPYDTKEQAIDSWLEHQE